jgi:Ca2+-binding RTX toxin-like protein
VTELSSPLRVRAGCLAGFPVVCAATNADVRLGDADDIANVSDFAAGDPATTVRAGRGDDDVLAAGGRVSARGGSGDDTVAVRSNTQATGDGGQGDDRVWGTAHESLLLTGAAGDDLLVSDISNAGRAEGGPGNDSLVGAVSALQVDLLGQDGDDVLTAPFSRHLDRDYLLDGGRGADVIRGNNEGDTVDAGPGDDLIDVADGTAANPDAVTCGKGHDTVWVDAFDTAAADCEDVIAGPAPELPGVAEALAGAAAITNHVPQL